uniref:Uncharacterized protein n=1 Tax=Cacopsylla melanoneura TaxID=428564 RepID=A0A8D9FFW6_9HEMI
MLQPCTPVYNIQPTNVAPVNIAPLLYLKHPKQCLLLINFELPLSLVRLKTNSIFTFRTNFCSEYASNTGQTHSKVTYEQFFQNFFCPFRNTFKPRVTLIV